MPDTHAAGPLRHATLIVARLQPLIDAYALLGLSPGGHGQVSVRQAEDWRQPGLAGCAFVWLATPDGAPLLRLIEKPGAAARPTRLSHGWLALEILVRDVDALGARLSGSVFQIVGAPADLAVSPSIRAMQLIGPAGEMLYLTQVKAAVPPFELPLSSALPATQDLGRLFIAVMSVPERAAALRACAVLNPRASLEFDTRVTVLSQALGRPLEQPWPVATLQWAGASLFEIDAVVDTRVATPIAGRLPEGLAWVSMEGFDAGLCELAPGAWLEGLPG